MSKSNLETSPAKI